VKLASSTRKAMTKHVIPRINVESIHVKSWVKRPDNSSPSAQVYGTQISQLIVRFLSFQMLTL
jgi:hypothetical protein